MRLLVLGGTGFVGRAVVEAALARSWEVTAFNRGSRAAPDGAVALTGDRAAPGGLAALDEGTWDAVVDTWSQAPGAVADAAALLAGRVRSYAYISSRSVYAYPAPPGLGEKAALVVPDEESLAAGDYASVKRAAELAAEAEFGDRALLVRAGLILGPYEDIGRLPWWLTRMARGGRVLAPGPADAGIQFVDVRDLAEWTLDAVERGLYGPYDLVRPAGTATMRELLEACAAVTGGGAELCWTEPERILAAGVAPWTDLPVWIPPGELYEAMHRTDVAKAVAAGLRCRPTAETVADTWAWLEDLGGRAPQRPDRPAPGLSPEVEATLL